MPPTLLERAPVGADADSAYTGFVEWATDRGISLYPAQDEAVIELVSGANVILSTPSGRGSRSSPSRRTRRASPGADAPTTPPRSSDFDRLLDSADGNPLALVELPATLHQPGPTPDWMPVGELIVASFTARMSDLPAPTRRLLLAAALGNDVPLGRLCAAAAAAGAESVVVGDLQPAVLLIDNHLNV